MDGSTPIHFSLPEAPTDREVGCSGGDPASVDLVPQTREQVGTHIGLARSNPSGLLLIRPTKDKVIRRDYIVVVDPSRSVNE